MIQEWQALVKELKPLRLMWWANFDYWSVQGPIWAMAKLDKASDIGRWFSWGPENCSGIPPCYGDPVPVPNVGCAQGSWRSEGGGKGVPSKGVASVLASFGSSEYAEYLADAMANSWTRNLGIDGYTIDCSAK